jgi:hypothetical protein
MRLILSATALPLFHLESPIPLTCDAHVVAVESLSQSISDDRILHGGVAHLYSSPHLHCVGSLGVKGERVIAD